MRCSRCGSENEAARKFCGECGQPLAAVCSACATANPPGTKFCGECGAPLGSQPRPRVISVAGDPALRASVAAQLTEIRRVSVLFADLVGFTSLSESRDAEEVRDLLSRYFETCRQLIARYGGSVEKFIGDAVMAVWGTPIAREDDAERAVRAALELTSAVAALGVEAKLPDLRARAGVLTGEAAVNVGAEGQGMVAGDLVNTASRIQAAAPPGAVYVGDGTRRSSDAAVAYEDAGLHELKGKAEPVQLWRAVRVIGLLGGSVRQSELEPPFVGRDRELHLIKELFHVSTAERRPHLVSVMGVGGIGKSRLSWEFEKYVDGLVEEMWWHRGRCLAYGEGVAFWALAEMVRMRAGILEDEDTLSARGKLHERVGWGGQLARKPCNRGAFQRFVRRVQRAGVDGRSGLEERGEQRFGLGSGQDALDGAVALFLRRRDLSGGDPQQLRDRAPGGAMPHFWSGCAFFAKALAEEKPEARLGWMSRAEEELRRALEAAPDDWDTKYDFELVTRLAAELRKQPKTPPSQLMRLLRPQPQGGAKPVRRVG